MPKISVIMPVYNTKEIYLRPAIESVLNQTYTDFELIIIDNGSKKETVQILEQYKDNRIKLYRLEENLGPAGARNLGIENAKGEFIAFNDSDDISSLNRFEKQIEFFEKNKDIGCLGTASKHIYNGVEKIQVNQLKSSDEIECFLIFNGCAFTNSTVMLRKEVLDKYNLRYALDDVPAEDYKMWINLIGKTKFHIMDDVLLTYNFYPENISSLRHSEQEEKTILFKQQCLLPFLKEKDAQLFVHILSGKPHTFEQLKEFSVKFPFYMDVFSKRYSTELFKKFLKKKIKKIFYKTHSLKGQLFLFRSSFGQIFNFSLSWRLWCLITKGVL
ncbi:MAG: glycosyltransferase family 2 protein [Alphaproteobacteria bacterium]|nr:glycosyltransferase family 2 protein [Alphaproteobacteria bacterium]